MPDPENKKLIEQLYQRLNVRGLGPHVQPNIPDAPPIEVPPLFRRPTKETGLSSEQSRQLHQLYRFAPQLRGLSPNITSGYGPSYIQELMRDGNPELLNRVIPLSLYGVTRLRDGAIDINNEENFPRTLVHEFQHVIDAENMRRNVDKPMETHFNPAVSNFANTEDRARDTHKLFDQIRHLIGFGSSPNK
jgi:hypothetical protein